MFLSKRKRYTLILLVLACVILYFIRVHTKKPYRIISSEQGTKTLELKEIITVKFPFYVFSGKQSDSSFFLSGYMGDIHDLQVLKTKDPETGGKRLKVIYKRVRKDGGGWCGLYWQYPPNNWGDDVKGGYDLRQARYLYFTARGERGTERAEFKIGGIPGRWGDSDEATTGIIQLSNKARTYRIDLRKKDLKNIIGGFCFMIMEKFNPEGAVFYIHDIYYSDRTCIKR
ncbi:MAG: hypothetical protein JW827_00965 [Spirochaetes bacterium]|nr:hypothetical protein [Spirochaetota bacterium]